jgi:hypothetical protein
MALSTFDFVKGIDFTGLATAAAGDHNTLIDNATPYTDKGLVGETTDSAVGVPVVPNVGVTTKWATYVWKRTPHAADTNKTPWIYIWCPNAASVATYLQWQRVTADTATELALIAALDTRVDAVEVSTASALATANAANAQSAQAALDAATALTNANAASANAATALGVASDAQAESAEAITQSTAATATAAAATTVAGTANTTATAASQVATSATLTQSADFALTLGTQIATILHGFGVVPRLIRCVLVCYANDGATGHVAGDEIAAESAQAVVGPTDVPALYTYANATAIYIRTANVDFTVAAAATGVATTLTMANWRARCYYSKT